MASIFFETELSPLILQSFKILISWKDREYPEVFHRYEDTYDMHTIQIIMHFLAIREFQHIFLPMTYQSLTLQKF